MEGVWQFAPLPSNLLRTLLRGLDQIPFAIAITNAASKLSDLRFLYVNKIFAELTGYGRSEIEGKAVSILYGPKFPAHLVQELSTAIQRGSQVSSKTFIYNKERFPIPVGLHLIPILGTSGQFSGYIGIANLLSGTPGPTPVLKSFTTDRKKLAEEYIRVIFRRFSRIGHARLTSLEPLLIDSPQPLDPESETFPKLLTAGLEQLALWNLITIQEGNQLQRERFDCTELLGRLVSTFSSRTEGRIAFHFTSSSDSIELQSSKLEINACLQNILIGGLRWIGEQGGSVAIHLADSAMIATNFTFALNEPGQSIKASTNSAVPSTARTATDATLLHGYEIEFRAARAIALANGGDLKIRQRNVQLDLQLFLPPEAQDETGSTKSILDSLTPREREVFEFLGLGMTNDEISLELGISTRTVEAHRTRLMRKLGASSVFDVMKLAQNTL